MSSSGGDEIRHVSDTALMVAACRAIETGRADGLVRDPFAEKLAGERGASILRGISGWELICFGIGVRSHFVDQLVAETVAACGIETVVSAGAGLDTRPWRLALPSALRWVEVDFPDMLDYKRGMMAAEKPHCRLERMAADLTDASQRQAVFAAAGAARGLLITEGLLMYLPGTTVEGLAAEAAASSGIRYWLLDISSLDLARLMGTDQQRSIESVRAPDHLPGAELLDVVRSHSWTQIRLRSYARDSGEIAGERIRAMIESSTAAGVTLPAPAPDDPSGVYLFGRE